ncbi:hypothetical protein PRZ48_001916 [Zasmidium cellare]|uniref:Methyltransferase type 12 domain-containing protein n=1 Tax=Zasmidium cellare TaxID=395010 RepID=A0ABR0F552_ZASCE|nr:hypothetical protein PRZ48_001916 [Zasmidium cellare]
MAEYKDNYITLNKANWDERAPEHSKSEGYDYQHQLRDPNYISDVVKFDIPLMGDITGLEIVHLQCHIATDTLSLVRRGAKRATGLDFSGAAIKEAKHLAAKAVGGDKLDFVEASVYDALEVLPAASFDMVFTGIGALCWIPSIKQWAETVAALLKPGGRLFIREYHPALWAIDDTIQTALVTGIPYFERDEPHVYDDSGTYVKTDHVFENTKTVEWNHGIGEIIQSLIDVGMSITGLVEHKSLPWNALHGQMEKIEPFGEFALKQGRDNLPLSYTLQAKKNA